MNLGRFNAILDAYGAEPSRWPDRERAEALAFSRSSIAAARALAQARALDTALKHAPAVKLEAEPARFAYLHAQIMSRSRLAVMSWPERWLGIDLTPRQLWPSVAGLALATLLGFAVGVTGLMQDNSHDLDDMMLSAVDAPAIAP